MLGVAAVPVIYLIARRMIGERAGCAAAFLMASSNFHIDHSQAVKAYALYFLAAALALLALVAACDRPEKRRAWAGYGLALAALLYTHAIAPFVALALAVFGAVRLGARLRGHLRAFAGAHAMGLILFLPWLVVAVPQALSVLRDFWAPPPTSATLIDTVNRLLLIPPRSRSAPLVQQEVDPGLAVLPFGEKLTSPLAAPLWLSIPWLALLLAVAAAVMNRSLRPALAVLVLLLIPMAALFVTSRLVGSIYLPRVLLPSLMAITLLLSAPFAEPDARGPTGGGGAPRSTARGPLLGAARAASAAAFCAMLAGGVHLPEVRIHQALARGGTLDLGSCGMGRRDRLQRPCWAVRPRAVPRGGGRRALRLRTALGLAGREDAHPGQVDPIGPGSRASARGRRRPRRDLVRAVAHDDARPRGDRPGVVRGEPDPDGRAEAAGRRGHPLRDEGDAARSSGSGLTAATSPRLRCADPSGDLAPRGGPPGTALRT